jgi:multiple sugar transport system substrate-binding protein
VAQVASRNAFMGTSDGQVMPYEFGEYGGAWMEPINSALNAVLLGEMDVDAAPEEAQGKLDRLTGHDG